MATLRAVSPSIRVKVKVRVRVRPW